MPRRKPEDPDENHERWLVSYSDFITLLFAFFVVMYALSSVNEGKYRVLSDSLVAAFRNVTVNAKGTEMTAQADTPTLQTAIRARKSAKAEEQRRRVREKVRQAAARIADILAPLVREGRVRVTETTTGVTVEINANVLFAVGDARLNPDAVAALRAVAQVLGATEFPVTVEGHTDDTPIATAQFPSNWELSAVRASSVIRLFVEAGVTPQRLTAAGFGEQRPVADNATLEGRARNRRVAILIEAPTVNEVPAELRIAPPDSVAEPASDAARQG